MSMSYEDLEAQMYRYKAEAEALRGAAANARELLHAFVTHQCVTSDRFVNVLRDLDAVMAASLKEGNEHG